MKLKENIGLIGVGNMGSAILEGLFAKQIAAPGQVWVYDKLQEKSHEFSAKWKTHEAGSNAELVKKTEFFLLAVKPQDLQVTVAEIQPSVQKKHVLISILAGTPIAKIKDLLGAQGEIVRAMPNLGAKVGQSMTALTSSSKKALEIAEAIFTGCGKTVGLPEDQFDLITALSGSGPAYFFYLMELMAEEGRKRGLSQDQARLVAIQTALGSALLAAESNEDPGALRAKVTSKGGTTEAALKELVKTFPETFRTAIEAAYRRGQELAK